jgi:hypothetical protein
VAAGLGIVGRMGAFLRSYRAEDRFGVIPARWAGLSTFAPLAQLIWEFELDQRRFPAAGALYDAAAALCAAACARWMDIRKMMNCAEPMIRKKMARCSISVACIP